MSAENTASGLDNSYTYDSDGLRLTKTVGDVQHKYVWQGSQLVSENWAGQELEFFYDESGSPYAFSYKASATATPVMYYYVTNLQGDVVNILDASGNIKASYTYNAWGEILSATGDMADINPLRYRGYYFDSDTGLYYLKARYYDPQLCRFINADGYASTGQGILGSNMFAYCKNNPVNKYDPNGNSPLGVVIALVTAAVAAIISGCNKASEGMPDDFHEAKGDNYRCYAYSLSYLGFTFGNNEACDPGTIYNRSNGISRPPTWANGSFTLETVVNNYSADLDTLGFKYTFYESYEEIPALTENSLVIAVFKTTYKSDEGNIDDYHFAVRLSNGVWADKPGPQDARYGKLTYNDGKWSNPDSDGFTIDAAAYYYFPGH